MKKIFLVFILAVPSLAQSPIALSPQDLQNYLAQISSMVAGRPTTPSERDLITQKGEVGLKEIIQAWIDSDFFVQSAKIMLQTQLGISGNDGTVNYELPGNLMTYLVRQDRPYSEIITADYCVDNSGNKINCDANAPFAAGVLATRGYLKQYASRFNLARAHNLMRQFACLEYPMNTNLQIPIPREQLIDMFKVDKAEGSAAFGNGTACYSCHSQFGAHAQLFIKFDSFGIYQPSATGQQDPTSEPGRSPNNLFTSHFASVSQSSTETSQMLGQAVSNLRNAAITLSNNRNFSDCAVRNTIRYFIRLTAGNSAINAGVVVQISDILKQNYPNPTFKQIVLSSLIHSMVIGSLIHAGEQ